MKRLQLSAALASFLLGAAPAFAGGFGVDLPRLDFPAPQPQTSRDCQTVATATVTCAPSRT